MTDTLQYIAMKWGVDPNQSKQPVEIPNTNRDDLAILLKELGLNVGAEIGVERGLYSRVLLQSNPDLQLFSIDAWTAYKGYREHVTQQKVDDLYHSAIVNLEPFGERSEVIKGFSADVAKQFEDESLDFVYIDGNHEYYHTVVDLYAWHRKVRPGGIVAGHDYVRKKNNGFQMHVIPAIHGWIDAYRIAPLFVLGRKDAPQGEKRDTSRSWFYVKS